MRIPDEMSDEEAVRLYRERFLKGPVGEWYYDNDINMGFGGSILFQADGIGLDCAWDDARAVEEPFCWDYISDQRIILRPHPDTPRASADCTQLWRAIDYDFEVRLGDQEVRDVYLFERGCEQKDRNRLFGFWESPFALLWNGEPLFLLR